MRTGNKNATPYTPVLLPRPCPKNSIKVSRRAKIRGLPQLGTLGAGNHYAEIQVVEEVFDQQAAKKMGIDKVNQVRGAASHPKTHGVVVYLSAPSPAVLRGSGHGFAAGRCTGFRSVLCVCVRERWVGGLYFASTALTKLANENT